MAADGAVDSAARQRPRVPDPAWSRGRIIIGTAAVATAVKRPQADLRREVPSLTPTSPDALPYSFMGTPPPCGGNVWLCHDGLTMRGRPAARGARSRSPVIATRRRSSLNRGSVADVMTG
jgi:hypothetical protein